MKKYAIVRVNTGACPDRFENIKNETVCYVHRKKEFCRDENLICTECYYGDTKEQLIRKVATAIFRKEVKAYKKFWGIEPSRIVSADTYAQCLKVAKEIVEFLGVE